MRTLTTIEEIRKGRGYYGRETRVPFIRLRGRWLERYNFKPGSKVYIHEGIDGLTLTSQPPMQVSDGALIPLDEIKSKYKALGIPTEERTKKGKSKPRIEQDANHVETPSKRGEPFVIQIANTDPLDMTDDNFNAWVSWISSEATRAEWVMKRTRHKMKSLPTGKAEQLAFAFGKLDDEPIPLEHFTLKKISAKDYETLLKEN